MELAKSRRRTLRGRADQGDKIVSTIFAAGLLNRSRLEVAILSARRSRRRRKRASEMVDVDVLQSQTDSWASTNWGRSDETRFTTFALDYLKKSMSSSNQESNPKCRSATCELTHAWTICRERFEASADACLLSSRLRRVWAFSRMRLLAKPAASRDVRDDFRASRSSSFPRRTRRHLSRS